MRIWWRKQRQLKRIVKKNLCTKGKSRSRKRNNKNFDLGVPIEEVFPNLTYGKVGSGSSYKTLTNILFSHAFYEIFCRKIYLLIHFYEVVHDQNFSQQFLISIFNIQFILFESFKSKIIIDNKHYYKNSYFWILTINILNLLIIIHFVRLRIHSARNLMYEYIYHLSLKIIIK